MVRYIGSFLGASVVTFGLFFLMQYLIATGEEVVDEGAKALELAFIRERPPEFQPQRREELPDVDRPPPPPPPSAPQVNINPQSGEVRIAAPNVNPDIRIAGPDLGAAAEGDVLPLVRVPPQYPTRMQQMGIEGYVDVEFDINKTGTPVNPRVLESSHRGFERAAIRSVERWKYKPRIVNGEPVVRYNIQVRITFELEG